MVIAQQLAATAVMAQQAPQCPCTIFSTAIDPGLEAQDFTAQPGVNVGIKFTSDTAGFVKAIRFYKHVDNLPPAGTNRLGYLWDDNGNLLGTATFTNETSTGWQEAVLKDSNGNTGVAIAANTSYRAAYYVPRNPSTNTMAWPHNLDYFYTWGVDSPPLHVQGGHDTSAQNGVYAYGATGVFPNQVNSANPINYMVDVVFDTQVTPAATTPAISSTTPGLGASGLDPNTTQITVTFSKDMDASTISTSTVQLKDASNNVLPSTVTYSTIAGDRTATLIPTPALALNSTYTIFVSSAVKDLVGNSMTANYSGSFTTTSVAPNYQCPCTFWNGFVNAVDSLDDVTGVGGVNLGLRFQTDVSGVIKGIRFYKFPDNTGPHVAYLWQVNADGTGTVLASKQFPQPELTTAGYEEVQFDSPVPVTRHTTYIAAYYAPVGHWSELRPSPLHTGDILSAPLRALQNLYHRPNNVYSYGAAGTFPVTDPFDAPNYWLDVIYDSAAASAPAFTSVNATTFTAGTAGSFTVTTSGSPAATITETGTLPNGVSFVNNGNGTGTLSGTPAAGTGGTYPITFTATNTAGNGSQSFTLTVNQLPAITTQPTSQTICSGATATFTAAASGFPAPTVQWQSSPDGTTWTNITGAITTSFVASTAAQYRAVFTNTVGSATTTAATLTVNTAPTVTTNPANQTACAGTTATFTAAATGSTSVQWQVSTDGVSFVNIAGATSTTLSFTTAATDNSKQYRAVFTNSCGSTNTTAATLTTTAPVITTNPVNTTACAGTTATFTAAATGSASVQWQQSTNNGSTWSNVSGATSPTLSFTTTSNQSNNQYRAVFTNACGSTTTAAAILISAAPKVSTQPTNQTVCPNTTATFTAVDGANSTVQWQVEPSGSSTFTNIPGATSTTYTFTAATSDNGSKYQAVFTNTCGTTPSNTVTLTVNTVAAPTITGSACAGGTLTSSNNCASCNQWYLNGVILSGQTTRTITATATGIYTVTASGTQNGVSCTSAQSAPVTVNPVPTTPTITPNTAIVQANSTGNTASGPAGATTYAWTIAGGTITAGTSSQTVTYTAGASGNVTLNLTVTNSSGCSANNSAQVPINRPPVAANDSPSTDENTPAAIVVLANDSDPDGDPLTVTGVTPPSHGTTSINADSSVQYTPNTNYSGSDTFSYTISDGRGGTASATVTVTVKGVNNPPVANADFYTTGPNTALNVATSTQGVLGNDTDPDGDTLTAAIVSSPTKGTLTLNGNGTFTYTPSSAFTSGTDTFTYKAMDSGVTTSTDESLADFQAGAVDGCTALTLYGPSGGDVMLTPSATGFVDAFNGTLISSSWSTQRTVTVGGGFATFNNSTAETTATWVPASGVSANLEFVATFNAVQGQSVGFGSQNVGQIFSGGSWAMFTTDSTNPVHLLAKTNSTTTDLGTTFLTTPHKFRIEWTTTGVTYYVDNTSVATHSVVISTAMHVGGQATASSNFSVDWVRVGPYTHPCTFTSRAHYDDGGTWTTLNPTLNLPANTTVTWYTQTASSAAGPWPDANWVQLTGNPPFAITTTGPYLKYKAVLDTTDGNSPTIEKVILSANLPISSATVTISIPPITPAATQVCAGSTGNTATGPAGMATYAWSITGGTINGATNTQNVTYTAGAAGTAALTLTVTNGQGWSNTSSVNITVNAVPVTPTISTSGSTAICQGSSVTLTSSSATGNQWYLNGSPITGATGVTYSANAAGDYTVVVSLNGCTSGTSAKTTVTVNQPPATPTASNGGPYCESSTINLSTPTVSGATYAWTGPNNFTSAQQNPSITNSTTANGGVYSVTITVNGCTSQAGTTTVTVNAKPATPTISAATSTTFCNGFSVVLQSSSATGNQWYRNGTPISGAIGQQYTATTAGDYTVIVTSASNCSSTASAATTVTVNDNPATPTITTANNVVNANSTGNIASGPAGATSYKWTVDNGTIVGVDNAPSVTFTAGPSGTLTLHLTVTNSSNCPASSSATLTINTNHPPVANNDSYAVASGQTTSITAPGVLGNDTDADGDSLTAAVVSSTSHGSLTLNSDGSFSYTPNSGFIGLDSFTYQANDGKALSNTATVTIEVDYKIATGSISNGTTTSTTFTTDTENDGATPADPVEVTLTVPGGYGGDVSLAPGTQTTDVPPSGFTFLGYDADIAAPVATAANPLTIVFLLDQSILPDPVHDNAQTIQVFRDGVLVADCTGTPGTASPDPCVAARAMTSTNNVSLTVLSSHASHWNFGKRNNNNPPVATADAYSICQAAALTLSAPGVLSNDTDADHNTLTTSLVTGPAHAASFTLNANGSFSYTPVPTYSGTDSFTYKAFDGIAFSDPVTVTITINATPATPNAQSNGSYCAGQTINLTTDAVPGATYAWSGPNGFTSSQQNPTITNATTAASGTYSVTVTVNGCPSPAGSTSVTVNAVPSAATVTPAGPLSSCGSSITLTSTAPSGNQWYVDGNKIDGATSSTYSATTTGTYTVIVTTNGCPSATSNGVSVTINSAPAAPTVTVPASTCTGSPTSIQATFSGGTGNVDFGDGTATASITSGTAISHTFANAGTYSVAVTITSGSGCTSSTTKQIVVNATPVTPTISASGPLAFCQGGSLTLTSSSATGNQWFFNGNPIANATNATYSPTATGDYTVQVTSSSGCVSTTSAITTVTINPPPPVPTVTLPASACTGSPTSVMATFSGGTGTVDFGDGVANVSIANGVPLNHTFANAGTYNVVVTITSGSGCTSSTTKQIVVNATPATPAAHNGGPYCEGQTISLSTDAVAGATYAWTGPNSFTSTDQNPTISNATTANGGTYSLTITVNGCPSPAATTNVVVNANPTKPSISVQGTTTFCQGGSATLTSSSTSGNQWYKDGVAIPGAINSTYSATASGNYTVTVTNGSNCSATSDGVSVTVNNAATATISADGPTNFCQGGQVTLTASSGSQYLWSTGDTSPSIVVRSGGTYTVQVTNATGCTATASTNVTVNALVFANTGSWTGLASSPTARRWATDAVLGGLLYAAGGAAPGSTNSVATVEAYDPKTNTWSTIPSLPSATQQADAAVINGMLYVVGGGTCCSATNALQIYDPASNTWSAGTPMPTARYKPAVANMNGLLFAIGGTDGHSNDYAGLVEVYDPATKSWSGRTSVPGGRQDLSLAVANGVLYAIGGRQGSTPVATVEVFNPASNSWIAKTSMPTARYDARSTVLNGIIYTFGGHDASTNLNTVEAYDPSTDKWTTMNSMTGSFSRGNLNSDAIGSLIYVLTEPTDSVYNTQSFAPGTRPLITTSGATTFCSGGSVTLTASAGNSYLWSTGETSQSITVTASGNYSVTVTELNGCSATSAATTVTVNPAPAITTQPISTTVAVGATATFTAAASNSTSVQWQSSPDGQSFSDIPGAISTTLSFTASSTDNGKQYRAVFANSNGCNSATTAAATLTVNQTPAITSANNTTFTVGTAGSFTVTATGSPAPSLSESGTLPSGVTFNATTGVLSGTPAAGTGGSYTISFTASNGVGTNATQTFTLTVNQAPAITSANNTTFTVGTAGSFTVAASGFPTATFSESGTLPSGVTFNTSSGVLSGTPAASTGASYAITFTASNGVGTNATQSFTLTVNQAPAITSANNTTFTVGTAGSFTVAASGFPAATFSESGTLPSGVTFNTSNGVLSGTPAAGTGGSYAITFTASNGVGTNATQTFTLSVNQAPAITSANNTTFTVGTAGSFTVVASGFPAPTFSESGTLPSGVTFNTSTGVLSGTPAPTTGGSYAITLTASNGVGTNATQSFTLTVNQAPAITSANNTTFTVGTAGSFTVAASGFPAPTLSESGTLPSGITFNATTGVLSGTPAAGTGGTYPITFTAAATGQISAQQSFTLTVNQAPAITSANSTTFTVGAAGSFSVTTSGFPTPALTETGTLPSGVTFVDNHNGTATLAGTPAAGTGANYPITINAGSATQSFTLSVNQAPAITSANSTTFTVGTAGSFTVTATGFPAPALSETGALPSGVTFNTTTGVLSGTPAAGTGGNYPITFSAGSASQLFTLMVNQAPAITSANATTFTVGAAGSFSITTTGFPTSALSESGPLPIGVTFVDNHNGTATLAGTPAAGTGANYPIIINAGSATQSFTLTVNQAPFINSALSATFTVGTAGSFTLTATGFPTPITFSETGALPNGVTLSSNGVLSGTPTVGGTFTITVTATNGAGSQQSTFTLTVNQAPAITSANSTTFNVDSAGSFTVTASGIPAPTFSESGALPSGVTFSGGVLSGTPARGTGGTYPLTFTATNAVGSSAPQSFTLTVNESPFISSAPSTTFTVGVAGSFTFTATGFPTAMTYSETGALPTGVTLSSNGLLSGTPTVGGVFNIIVTVANSTGSQQSMFTLTVNQAPSITSANSAAFSVGAAGSFNVTASGVPAPTLSESGTLPSGVSFNTTTGVLSGTPASGTGGTYPITFTASNGVLPNATQSFTLTVSQAPSITSANHATFTALTAGSFTVTTTGVPAATLSETGNLPTGISFNATTGVLSGTPAAGTGGTYPITFTASNGVTPNATQSFTLTINQSPAITSGNATTFTVGTAGSFTVTASGTPTPTLSVSGTLPTGVTFTAATGVLAGTPAVGTGGSYPLTFTASNGVLPNGTQSFTLTVNEPPAITSANNATFTAGIANSFTVTATGSPAPSITETATLPSGLTFSGGVLSGTPTVGGIFTLSFTASNGVGSNATQPFTLTIYQAPLITSAATATFTTGTAGSFTVTASGFPAATFTQGGTLPAGVTFNTTTGVLSGTPTTAGTYPLTFTATNTLGSSAAQSFTLTVSAPVVPVINIGNASMQPPASGTTMPMNFPVTLSVMSSQTVTVHYFTSNSTAIAGTDYVSTSGTLTFLPGETSKTISVNIIGKTSSTQKVFVVPLDTPVNATIKTVFGTPVRGNGTILAK